MKYRKVQAFPEPISSIGFGCWAIGGTNVNTRGYWAGSSDPESIRAIHRALDLGINLFDVAPIYGMGHAEEVLGQALLRKRSKAIIASKCGMVWDDHNNVTISLKPESIRKEVTQSLKRLKTDTIDIYQMHWPDPQTNLELTMQVMQELIAEGKIRYVGLSNFSAALSRQAIDYGIVASYQGLYNLFERNPSSYYGTPLDYRMEDEIIPLCLEKGLAFFPYSPLFQGFLTDAFDHERGLDQLDTRNRNPNLTGEKLQQYLTFIKEIKIIAHEIGKPLSQLAINWLLRQEAVTCVISGAQTVHHIEENAASAEWVLSDEIHSRIEQILQPLLSQL